MNFSRKRLFLWITASFILLFLHGDFNAAGAFSEKPKVIKLPCIIDISGPYAPITAPAYSGFSDACEYINQNGGVKGVPVEAMLRDCSGNVSAAISYYNEFIEMKPKPLAIFISVSAEGEALRERIAEDDIVAMCVPGTPALYPAANTFGVYPLYQDMYGGFIDWLTETWDWKTMKRKPRVAILTLDSTFGRAILTNEVFAYTKSKNVDLVAKELFSIRDMDVSTQLLRIKMRKPDWIFSQIGSIGASIIAKSAFGMRYKIKLASNTTLDQSALLIGGELLEGAIVVATYASWDDEDHQGIKLLAKWFTEKKRRPQERTIVYQLAWIYVLTMQEVLSRTVEKVGWVKLNGSAVKEQMETLKDFSPLDLTYYSFSSKKRSPSKGYMAHVKDGKIIPTTEWRELPDLRPAKFR
ncbi:MAG: ABC transporter substrate-binding protein [Thermodesulfobacteriota bacterium]|nr:ABC transporter substrate-binding protein [Thermodesulfobacteriota bacterium]